MPLPVECLHYSMSLPTSVVITGCDSLAILQQALQAARSFQPMDSSQVAALSFAKTAKAAEAGQFELYKTSISSMHLRQPTVAWLEAPRFSNRQGDTDRQRGTGSKGKFWMAYYEQERAFLQMRLEIFC